jgi:DNA-binding transcriptional LysR family regulator
MSKLERISAFIEVVEKNSFAAAARHLGVSTAAISRQVSRLEADLGVSLLRRTTRQLALTEMGSQYYQQCKKVLGDLSEAELLLADSQAEAKGILSVTSSRYFALNYLIPRLAEFSALNPKLQIKFELAERFPDLAQEGIDLLFGVSMEGPAELVRRRVATSRYVLCASPDYLKKYGTPKTPEDLTKHLYITHSMRKPDNLIKFKDGRNLYLNPTLWINDSRAMRECAIQGMGIVNLHDYIVADALAEGSLIAFLSEYQEKQQPVYLYYQQSRYLQPKIRRFIDFYAP